VWIVTFSALAAILSAGCLMGCVVLVQTAGRERESLHVRVRSCESRTESLVHSLNDIQNTMEVLANRVKMQRVRNSALHALGSTGGEPDVRTDPEAWRAWKNAQLRAPRSGDN